MLVKLCILVAYFDFCAFLKFTRQNGSVQICLNSSVKSKHRWFFYPARARDDRKQIQLVAGWRPWTRDHGITTPAPLTTRPRCLLKPLALFYCRFSLGLFFSSFVLWEFVRDKSNKSALRKQGLQVKSASPRPTRIGAIFHYVANKYKIRPSSWSLI